LGSSEVLLENYEDAIDAFSRALRVNPDYTVAMYNRAIVYEKMGAYLDACDDWEEAYSLGYVKAKEHLDIECR
jgi:tetratricopeptide (TPR) repeat protein